jgi:HTH-type transcriptional regulator / antitoxin HipB
MGARLTTPHDVGALVRNTRRAQGLTQDDVALLAGTGRRFVVELERGKPTIRLDGVMAVLAALGIELEGHAREDG